MIAIAIAALAGHRAARAASLEKITASPRRNLQIWAMDIDATDKQIARRQWLVELVGCPHCLGFWLTAFTLIVYLAARRLGWRWLCVVVECWAAAGIQSTLTSRQVRDDDQAELAAVQVKLAKAELADRATNPPPYQLPNSWPNDPDSQRVTSTTE